MRDMLGTMQKGGVNVVGSANMDLVVRCPRFPAPGETILGGVFGNFPGGKGANQAMAIARLGGKPRFIAKIGDDAFGREMLQLWTDAGIDVECVGMDSEEKTGIAVITVDKSGENQIIVASGANMRLTPKLVESALNAKPAAVLLAQLEVPLETIIRAAAAHAGVFILNPAPGQELPAELLRQVDILVPNETEVEILTGIRPDTEDACHTAGQALLKRGVKAVVITRGSKGCALVDSSGVRRFRAFPVKPVDTTAAGDAFCGALAHFVSRGRTLDEALPWANATAALATTKEGAQPSMPTLDEVERFLSKHA